MKDAVPALKEFKNYETDGVGICWGTVRFVTGPLP